MSVLDEQELATLLDPDTAWELEAQNAEDFLCEFVRQAFPVLEPGRKFLPNWHIDAICDHLEAVTDGRIQNLIINIPPRCMKSLITCVFWPVWTWIKRPEWRWIFSAYAQDLATRDSMKCRRLIESPWFQARWGDRFKITTDQNEKKKFENMHLGFRLATSTEGRGTGEGGDVVVVDDPHSVAEALSKRKREAANAWWDETMTNRLNDDKGRKVIIMQRLHEDDLSGHVLRRARQDGEHYEHLCIPMEYEVFEDEEDRPYPAQTSIGWKDPRSKPGESLWPLRFPEGYYEKMRASMGQYAAAGQYQQRPSPRGGGLFQREWFKIVEPNEVPQGGRDIRYWDMAGTEDTGVGDPDWTSGCRMRKVKGCYYILDMQRHRKSPAQNKDLLKQTAKIDGRHTHIYMEQEPGSSGKAVIDDYARTVFQGYVFRGDRPTGDKVVRADPLASAAEMGLVYLVRGDWNYAFLEEAVSFPAGIHDDQIDSASGAKEKLDEKKTFNRKSMRH